MPRLPYKPDAAAGPEEIVAAIRERRGGTLLHLDRSCFTARRSPSPGTR